METTITAKNIEVLPDKVEIETLQISGRPAFRIIEGTLEGIQPLATLDKMLEVGAVALESVQISQSIQHIEKITEGFAKIVNKEANENFPRIINEHSRKMIDELSKFLDPKQVDSVKQQVERAINDAVTVINNDMKSEMKAQRNILNEGLKNLGYLKEAFEKSTQKGTVHEDYVGETLEKFAGQDLVSDLSQDQSGKSYAKGKSKSGDYRVTLGETASSANPVSFVVEAKDKKMNEKDALKELQENKTNRGVQVGILVFAKLEQAPTQGRMLKIFPGNNIMVVVDRDRETAFYAAYVYARFVASSTLSKSDIDMKRVSKSMEQIMIHLNIESQVNDEARKITQALSRLVSTSLTARSNVLDVVAELQRSERK